MTDGTKAWRTKAMDVVSLVYAANRGQARAITVHDAAEAGYDVRYTDVHATRAPERDAPIAAFQRNKCLIWGRDFQSPDKEAVRG
jgi:hypothetical protein